MPRQPRLDAPGLLQHVMARGIERKQIFKDGADRRDFLERLATILEETQTQCYAWALIPNHFHLLLRTGATPLSKVMRRLMTGYAVSFNKRHRRAGHLFQNRYKSIVCEEDPYLLELLRYIHLNPLRARLVGSLVELDEYPWAGHSVILGNVTNPLIPHPATSAAWPGYSMATDRPDVKSLAEKTIEDVLILLGGNAKEARTKYRSFVKDGIKQGVRPELQGGGLIRSAGGDTPGLLGRSKEARQKGDERILGSGEFVTEALQRAGHSYGLQSYGKPPLSSLLDNVSDVFGVAAKELKGGSRRRTLLDARSVAAYLAVRQYGYKGVEVAEALSLSSPTVSRIVENGQKILDNNRELAVRLQRMEI